MVAAEYLQYHIFLGVAPVTTAINLLIMLAAWRYRRSAPSMVTLFLLVLAITGFLLCNSFEQLARTEALTVLFSKLAYPFIVSISVIWLSFALQYTVRNLALTAARIISLCIIPAVTCFLAFTNEMHGMIWDSVRFVEVGNLLAMRVTHGFFFYIGATYSYLLLLAGIAILSWGYFRRGSSQTKPSLWIVAGAWVPLVFNALYLARPFPFLVKDFTPFGFFFSAVFFVIGVLKYRLLELLPLARTVVMDRMSDGIIILDRDGRIVDLNSAAREAIGETPLTGGDYGDLSQLWPDLAAAISSSASTAELERQTRGSQCFYRAHITPLQSGPRLMGRLVTLNEVTEQTLLLRKTEEMARTDALTGLYNRRHFMDLAQREIHRSERHSRTVAIAMLDLDHFKRVNDEYGHAAGDTVLMETAAQIESQVRDEDMPARYGGEEFVLLMPETDLSQARMVCERIRQRIEAHRFAIETGEELKVTVSIGVAAASIDKDSALADLIESADRTLYRAKNTGRNCVVVSDAAE